MRKNISRTLLKKYKACNISRSIYEFSDMQEYIIEKTKIPGNYIPEIHKALSSAISSLNLNCLGVWKTKTRITVFVEPEDMVVALHIAIHKNLLKIIDRRIKL